MSDNRVAIKAPKGLTSNFSIVFNDQVYWYRDASDVSLHNEADLTFRTLGKLKDDQHGCFYVSCSSSYSDKETDVSSQGYIWKVDPP